MGELFVNLARRNQSLVQRQLELLDELERNEHDPAALDALLKLDHMATRMRRNAESLLVLSGAEQPRQWQQPIALIDVVRAAAAEIADFPRVELVGIDDDLAVSGRVVSDLAHLLAELLENATSFSPPESAVVVSGAVSATGFVLAVSDQGIGMPPDRIAEANRLLARPPVVGLAMSRALGFHVVGSLAARHAIAVEVRPGVPSGLIALVSLPTAVLEPRRGAVPAPAPGAAVRPAVTPTGTSTGAGNGTSTTPGGTPVPPAPASPPMSAPVPGAAAFVGRPPDEPPVEDWRLESLTAPSGAPAPATPEAPGAGIGSAPPTIDVTGTQDTPVHDAPVQEPSSFETATHDAVGFDTGGFDTNGFDPHAFDPHAFDPHAFDPHAFDGLVDPAPGAMPGSPSDASAHLGGPSAADDLSEPGPLPTRIPGRHLTHQPAAAPGASDPAEDPMRPYRVHELLTRHTHGKQRGQLGEDAPPASPVPDQPVTGVPGAPDHVQEDGR
jgi:hypothetical protein